jgi:PAS domain S-box-containing protein
MRRSTPDFVPVHRRLPMAKVAHVQYDVGAAVAQLADDLLNPSSGAANPSAALDHLRQRLHGADALVWLCDGERAWRALHAGHSRAASDALVVDLHDGAATIQRLRHSGALACRAGDVSGLEPLLPPDARSFVAAGAVRRDTLVAVLIIGWPDRIPPFEGAPVRHLRVAAALLANALGNGSTHPARDTLADAVLGSLAEQLAVVDGEGIVIRGTPAAIRPDEEKAVRDGIDAVRTGAADGYQALCPSDHGEHRWSLLTVRPLRRPEGGAVIERIALAQQATTDFTRRLKPLQFQAFADTLPVPVWEMEPDGRLRSVNERWTETGGEALRAGAVWTDGVHPDDRERAASALAEAASRGEAFEIELRLKAADHTYRWSACRAVPRHLPDGTLDSYVGACSDASAKHRIEAALARVAGKLVAAQESERGRIARELHDDLGQQVAVLASKLDAATRVHGARARDLRASLAETLTGLQELASSLHALSHHLHPAKLRLLGLVPTLESLCRDESSGTGVHVHFTARGTLERLPEAISLCLFRVAQEALRNALTHSGARRIDVQLTGAPDSIALRISDDGAGFDPHAVQATGLGLLTMRERVELVGGVLTLEAAQPTGTTISAEVPLPRHARDSVVTISGRRDRTR